MKNVATIIIVFLSLTLGTAYAAKDETLVGWKPFNSKSQASAKQSNKLILLNMEAVWCHWCHVMDKKTYSDPAVADYLAKHFISAREDSDARPDLANRYRAYGWPATIIMKADGTELVKRAGYISPENMLQLLKAVVADPSAEAAASIPSFKPAVSSGFSAGVVAQLERKHRDTYDWSRGGLKNPQKYIDANKLGWSLSQTDNDDEQAMAQQTLDVAMGLIDPYWGGVYQYSTGYDWNRPHFEKLLKIQARYMGFYAQGYQQFSEPSYLETAELIAMYVADFLTSPDGGFYSSQDADLIPGQHSAEFFELDDRERRDKGIPKVDKSIYAADNGQMISGLLNLYKYSNDRRYLRRSKAALDYIYTGRLLANNGFSRSGSDTGGPWLADSLYMAQAMLDMYEVSGDAKWLNRTVKTANFIARSFKHQPGGYVGSVSSLLPQTPDIEENIDLARFLNRLSHYSGKSNHKAATKHAVKFLASPDVALRRVEETGLLLLNTELSQDPAHFTVVAKKSDPVGMALFKTANAQAIAYKRVEWWDRSEGKLLNHDVEYPNFKTPAAYVCSEGRCSVPSFDAATYQRQISSQQ